MKCAALVLSIFSSMFFSAASAQNSSPASGGVQNAINGINSYPGPEFVKYEPEREVLDRRIDLFLSDWRGSMPRHEHGSLVLRNILTRGDNFAPHLCTEDKRATSRSGVDHRRRRHR